MSFEQGAAGRKIRPGLAVMLVAVLVTACAAGDEAEKGNFSSDPETARIERIVHDYIVDHAEVLDEAVQRRTDKATAKLIDPSRKAIETPFGSAWAGNRNGDVVLVEFFDYACTYCRASNADVDRLLAEDKNLKVVWREFPVLGVNSHEAARASLAAAKQGHFAPFFKQLYAAGSPSPETIAKVQAAAGVTPLTSAEFDQEIDKNNELARSLRATGTPLFIAGDRIMHGAVGYQALKDAIAAARRKKT